MKFSYFSLFTVFRWVIMAIAYGKNKRSKGVCFEQDRLKIFGQTDVEHSSHHHIEKLFVFYVFSSI